MKWLLQRAHKAFTLAELLIALALLGVIATFVLPKILTVSQNGSTNTAAHEVAAMISGALTSYQSGNVVTASTTPGMLTQYMNYVAVKSSGTLDDVPTYNSVYDCNSGITCLTLHSGGVLFYRNAGHFTATNSANAIDFFYDPDGVRTGSASDGSGKTLIFFLYANGRVSTYATISSGTVDDLGSSLGPTAAYDPSWFHW